MALPTIFENCIVQFSSVGTMGAAYVFFGNVAGSPIRCTPSATSVNLQPPLNSVFAADFLRGSNATASVGIALPLYVDATFPPAVGQSFPVAYYNAQNSLVQDNWTRSAQ